jgi:hypothetical protein
MKKIVCRILPVLMIALVIAVACGVAAAQGTPEEFKTNYFANNTTSGAPPATLRFTQHDGLGAHTECAMIYVYAADQQLAECCGCPVTYNGLVHENVQKDLLGNTLTRVIPNEGVIQIVSTVDTGVCDPTAFYTPDPEVDSWVTHIQNKVGTAFPITEDRGDEEVLSTDEYNTLINDCFFNIRLGSGFGVCKCNAEALQ